MNILIVEDDSEKAEKLQQFMVENYDVKEVSVARSFKTGLKAALTQSIDFMLLDMTMTNYDRSIDEEGGRPHHFAGREILRQLLREDIHFPVVVVTHFGRFGEEAEEVTLSELQIELAARFPDYLGTVHYRSNVEDWKDQLQSLIGDRVDRK